MRLIVDTNILFSFFRENPVRHILINAKPLNLELFTPQYAFQELMNNKKQLFKYARFKSEEEFVAAMTNLQSCIREKPLSFFKEYSAQGKKISPDEKDSPFFALALKIGAGIWTNEPRLKKQKVIKVLSTKDLREYLSKEN